MPLKSGIVSYYNYTRMSFDQIIYSRRTELSSQEWKSLIPQNIFPSQSWSRFILLLSAPPPHPWICLNCLLQKIIFSYQTSSPATLSAILPSPLTPPARCSPTLHQDPHTLLLAPLSLTMSHHPLTHYQSPPWRS